MAKTALALGTFDGLHTAHKEVLKLANGCEEKTAITFSVPPAMVSAERCELIISRENKEEMLKTLGFSVCSLDFNAVRNTEPTEFLENLFSEYNPDRICCGFNYRFGKNGAGDIAVLRDFCRDKGVELCVADEVEMDGERVSSSRIRKLLSSGKTDQANRLLGYDFFVEGLVSHGDGRGRKMSHPTVNFPYPDNIVVVKHGVYAAVCDIDGTSYPAVTYIGNRPTFRLEGCICETNILNFSGDLYGKQLRVSLVRFLREDRKFSSISELKNQIELDIRNATAK